MKFIKGKGALKNKASIIDGLKKGDESVFRAIYDSYRKEFLNWAERHYNVDPDVALDIFQESIANVYINAVTGKLTSNVASIKTYLFAIAKNHLRNYHNYEVKFESIDAIDPEDDAFIEMIDENQLNYENKETVKAVLYNIGHPCKQILEQFYLGGYGLETIAHQLGYSNKNVLKTTKTRCLQYLRNYLKV